MTVIIDRRDEPDRHKFGKDRARFLNRIREAVKKAVSNTVAQGSVKDFDRKGVKIPIPKKTTQEPVIHHEDGGFVKKVFPGNLYDVGDVVPIPEGGGGGGGNGGEDGNPDAEDSEEDFIWVPQDEFLKLLFEGRSLPDMTKLHNEANSVKEFQRTGHTTRGPSNRMDMSITNEKRRKEQIVLKKLSDKRVLDNLVEQYNIYREYHSDLPVLEVKGKKRTETLETITEVLSQLESRLGAVEIEESKTPSLTAMFNAMAILDENLERTVTDVKHRERMNVLRQRLPEQLKTGKKARKFQTPHLTYHFHDEVDKPAAKAVMICKMDVSASMSQDDKNVAKSFFWVLNKFLEANYDEVDVVFISHTTEAKEVDEQEFFYGRRTGGTLVSSCLEKELEIIKARYPTSEWNIYSAQASDGDNWGHDNEVVRDLMEKILPIEQASYFIEIRDPFYHISDLHEVYMELAEEHKNLYTATVNSPGEALDAFKSFFPVGGQSQQLKPSVG